MEVVRAYLTISGHVQGVNFRAYAREHARTIGVTGWVRNLDDGRVEAVFEGPKPAVQRLISYCYRGPNRARVERVEIEWQSPTGREEHFHILW